MKKIRRPIIYFIVCCLLCSSLSACGKKVEDNPPQNSFVSTEVNTPEESNNQDSSEVPQDAYEAAVQKINAMTIGEQINFVLTKKRDQALLYGYYNQWLLACDYYKCLCDECEVYLEKLDEKFFEEITAEEDSEIRNTIELIRRMKPYYESIDVLAQTQRYDPIYGLGVNASSLKYAISKAQAHPDDAVYKYMVIAMMQEMDGVSFAYNKEIMKNLEKICDEYIDAIETLKDEISPELYDEQRLDLARAYYNLENYSKCVELALSYYDETGSFDYYAMAMNAAVNDNDGETLTKVSKEFLDKDSENVVGLYYAALGSMLTENYDAVVSYSSKFSDVLENDESLFGFYENLLYCLINYMTVSDDALGARFNTACYKVLSQEQIDELHKHKLLADYLDTFLVIFREEMEDKNADSKEDGENAVLALTQSYPASGYANYMAGAYYMRNFDYATSAEYMNKAIDLWPNDPMLWYVLGYVEQNNGNDEASYRAASIANAMAPWNDSNENDFYFVGLHSGSIMRVSYNRMFENAGIVVDSTEEVSYTPISAEDYRTFAEENKDNPELYSFFTSLALLQEGADKYVIEKEINNMPDHTIPAYFFVRGEWSRRFEPANYSLQLWADAYASHPTWDYAALQLGYQLLDAGKTDDANIMFKKAILLNEDNPYAAGYLAYTYYLKRDEEHMNASLKHLATITKDAKLPVTDAILRSFGVDKNNPENVSEATKEVYANRTVSPNWGKEAYDAMFGSISTSFLEFPNLFANGTTFMLPQNVDAMGVEGPWHPDVQDHTYDSIGEASTYFTHYGAGQLLNDVRKKYFPGKVSLTKPSNVAQKINSGLGHAGAVLTVASAGVSLAHPNANQNYQNPAVELVDNAMSAYQGLATSAGYAVEKLMPVGGKKMKYGLDASVTVVGEVQTFMNSENGQLIVKGLMDNSLMRGINTGVANTNASIMNIVSEGSGEKYLEDLRRAGGNVEEDINKVKDRQWSKDNWKAKRIAIWMDKYNRLSKEDQRKYATWFANKLNEINNAGIGPDGLPVKKPNIYLYPEKDTLLTVTLGNPDLITVSDPLYENGWNIMAKPDGSLILNDCKYTYLFYECLADPHAFETEYGFEISAAKREAVFRNILSRYGLNTTEINDFVEFWTTELDENTDYVMYPQSQDLVDELMPLHISEDPDSILRLWFLFEKADPERTVTEPDVSSFSRNGFSVVEWGGAVR